MNIVIDKKACMGCRICEIACSQKHFSVYNPQLARLRIPNTYPLPSSPVICQQCLKPRCGEACPTGALYRADDMVAFDVDKCIGCGKCVTACPLHAIWMSEFNQPLKCDLCGGEPECAALCPKHALTVKSKNES